MASIMTYAQMANQVYEDDPKVDGWITISLKRAVKSIWEGDAFQGAAFKKGDEVIFAFKGTAKLQDVVTDLKLGVGMNTSQFANAGKFLKATEIHEGSHVSACGHSLGGAIAQIIGNRQRLPFVTFNAPGVGVISRNLDEMAVTAIVGTGAVRAAGTVVSAFRHPVQALRDLGSLFYRVKGVNFRLGMDVVGCIGVHYGKVIRIPYTGGALDILTKHKMTTMLAALEGTAYMNTELSALVN